MHAIQHVETMLQLSPRERPGQPLVTIGAAYLFNRQCDEAASRLLLSIQDQPGSYRMLAACEEARGVVAELRGITSQVMPAHLPWRNDEYREPAAYGGRCIAW